MTTRFVQAILAACLLTQVSPLWASTNNVKGIDIVVKKKPGGALAVSTTSDVGGRIRFSLPAAGDYTIVASQIVATSPVGLTLRGNFTSVGTAAAGALVSGANMNGAYLTAAGSAGSQGQIFSVDITTSGPVSFAGNFFSDSDFTASSNHLTFYSVQGGPSPLPQNLWLFNNTTAALNYSAAATSLGTPVTVNLPQPSGSIDAARSTVISVAPSTQGLAAGTYSAILMLTGQMPGAAANVRGTRPQDARVNNELEQVTGITVVVQTPTATNGTIEVDHVMLTSNPAFAGAQTPITYTVYNQAATTQNFTFAVDPATGAATSATITPGQFSLASGASQAVQVTTGTSLGYVITAGSGAVTRVYNVALPGAGTCTPAMLSPVVDQIYTTATSGLPNVVSLQAIDNCGNAYLNFAASVTINYGNRTQLLTVAAAVSSRAVSTTGISGKLAVFPTPCFFNSSYGTSGMTVTVAVQAANPVGGNSLTGSMTMPINYEYNGSAPILQYGRVQDSASFEAVALAPLEFFTVFGTFTGVPTTSAQTVPLGTTLGGLQVLVDGSAVPLYFVNASQANAILPEDLLPGTHQAAVFYNGILSGPQTFMVSDSNPSAFGYNNTAIIVNSQGALVSPSTPMSVGDHVTIYGNGTGLSSVPLTAGVATPLELLPSLSPVTVLVNNQPQQVDYAGFTPTAFSLSQINFTVTSTAPPAAASVVTLPIQLVENGNMGAISSGSFVPSSTTQPVATIVVQEVYPDANYLWFTGPSFYVNNQLINGTTGTLYFLAGTQVPLNVPPDPQTPNGGVQYTFTGWSQGGGPSQTLTVPPGNSIYTANFQANYLLTINGTATTSVSSSNGYYAAGTAVTINGSCPGGAAATGLLIANSIDSPYNDGGSVTYPNPTTIDMTVPLAVTVQCPAPPPLSSCVVPPPGMISWYSLDETLSPSKDISAGGGGANAAWIGNPTPVAGKVGGALSFTSGSQLAQAVNSAEGDIGTGDMSIDAWVKTTSSTGLQQIVSKPGGYFLAMNEGYLTFFYPDQPSGVWEWTDQAFGLGGPTFLADGKWHHVAVTIARTSLTGGSAMYVDGVPILLLDTKNQPWSWSTTTALTIGGGGFPGTNLAVDEVEIFNRALSGAEVGQIFAAGSYGKCKASSTVTDTVTTNPANLNVTIDGHPVTAPQPAAWAPGSSHVLGATSPQLNGVGNTQYTFMPPWTSTVGAITSSGAVASAPSTASTYTANFSTAYQVTLVLNGCAVGQTNPAGLTPTNPVFVAANGTVQVIISAAASLPNVFQNFVVNPPTNATLGAGIVTINPLTGPVTITANCTLPSTVTDIVTTNPANLKVTIDGGNQVTAPQTVSWTPASAHVLGAPSPQLNTPGDTQYTLSTTLPWTTTVGSITSNGAVTSAPATASTYTANFNTAYKVTLTLNGCSSQTNVPGLGPGTSSAFVSAGSALLVNIAPPTGQSITSATLNGTAQSLGGVVSVSVNPVNGPQTIVATCATPPNVVFTLTSRTGGNLSMAVGNTGATTATNVRILSITNITPSTVTYDPVFFSLPVLVPGGTSVPTGASGGFNLLFELNGSTSFTTSFSFLITAIADNEAQFTQTITVP
jgi:uncharacterized protein (TIGR03437 family)